MCRSNPSLISIYPFGWQSRYAVPDSTKGSDAESEYLLLCAHATLAETLLIGMAAHYREAFDLVHVVKLVQSLAKGRNGHEEPDQSFDVLGSGRQEELLSDELQPA
jgi:hypothetical protein